MSDFEVPAKVKVAIVCVAETCCAWFTYLRTYLVEVRAWKKFLPSRPWGFLSVSSGAWILFIVLYYCNGLQEQVGRYLQNHRMLWVGRDL